MPEEFARTKRSRLVVDLPEEDRAWVRAQSEATGWNSEALVVRMLIKDAREKGLGFAVVAQGQHEPAPAVPRYRMPQAPVVIGRRGPMVTDADLEVPEPVDPSEVDGLLADRLGERGIDAAALATEPWPDLSAAPQMAGVPAPSNGVAVSLEPAPKRDARSYR